MNRISRCCLMLGVSMSFFLTGCGTDNTGEGENSAAVDPVTRYMESMEGKSSASGDSAGSSDSSEAVASGSDDRGDDLPNIMENPAYSAMGRQVVTAVVTAPFRETMDRITAFNESNPDYFIEMKSYGGGAESFEALETQLPLEVLSGKGPDLVIWDGMNYSPALASDRLMENLYDFMEADPDFHREDYYENILQAFEINGGLYICPASFSVHTGCVWADELGTDRGVTDGWTLGEMMQTYENSPRAKTFAPNFTKEFQLQFICEDCMGDFVDWNSGKCHFDTPEFVELLEWCNTFPEIFRDHIDYEGYAYLEGLRSGQIFWQPGVLNSAWEVAYKRVTSGDADLLWPGHPVADDERNLGGGVAAPYGECYSICLNSDNPKAAWEVVKSFLAADAEREVRGIPLLRSVSEERIQDALTVEYETVDGSRQEKIKWETFIVIIEGTEEEIKFSCITEQDAETYRSIIGNTHRSYSSDPGILDIIMEEAGAYFGGDKDAATVADIIQNRVSMYVGERMK